MNSNPTSTYLDANVYLDFYSYPDRDLDPLEEIKRLIEENKIALYVPQQTKDEISRNRENIIATSIKQFSETAWPFVPSFMRGLEQAGSYLNAVKQATGQRDRLLKIARETAEKLELPADLLLTELLKRSKQLNSREDTYLRAVARQRKGNPPGKGASIGDQLNWETLLELCPNGDLYLVSKDGDFRSSFDDTRPKTFLFNEWKERKNGKLYLYKNISDFLAAFDIHIKGQTEELVENLLYQLANSPSYKSTHESIAALRPYMRLLGPRRAEYMIAAANINSQIRDILGDPDVRQFYRTLIAQNHGNSPSIDPELLVRFLKRIEPKPSTDEDDIPF